MAERIPIDQHKLRGTYRRDRHGVGVDFHPSGVPVRPVGLAGASAEFWDRHIVPLIESGVVGETDQGACESVCWWWSENQRLQAAVSATAPTEPGHYKLLTALSMAAKQLAGLCQSLGLSPYHRRRVRSSAAVTPGIAKRNKYVRTVDDLAAKFFVEPDRGAQ